MSHALYRNKCNYYINIYLFSFASSFFIMLTTKSRILVSGLHCFHDEVQINDKKAMNCNDIIF